MWGRILCQQIFKTVKVYSQFTTHYSLEQIDPLNKKKRFELLF